MKLKLSIYLSIIMIFGFACTDSGTSKTESLLPNSETTLDSLLDAWHNAAANSNLDAYFSIMGESFVFLGTDSSERWSKKEFYDFTAPYFKQGKGWKFIPHHRFWNFSEQGNVAWFDERLDTWMHDCRGSGVFTLKDGKWKMQQYNLAVTIENDKIQDYILLKEAVE